MGDLLGNISNFINNIFVNAGSAIQGFLLGLGLMPQAVVVIMAIIGIVILVGFLLNNLLVLIYLERKVVGFIQDRVGPNRVGPAGLLQSVADAIKLLIKEDIVPDRADKLVWALAPVIITAQALMVYAVIPFGPRLILSDLNVGLLYIISVSSVVTVGILMAGWGSNNKYSLLGGMRAVAQFISYEIPLGLALIGVIMLVGSLSTIDIVNFQAANTWLFILQPLAFIIYFIAGMAEVNRVPFDLVEAESEIVAGYHTEYSGMRFALFFLAEYLNQWTLASLGTTVFLGGWLPIGIPGVFDLSFIPPYLWYYIKAQALFFVLFWVRGTLPRFRIDQLMGFAWKGLIPLALFNIFATAAIWIVGNLLNFWRA